MAAADSMAPVLNQTLQLHEPLLGQAQGPDIADSSATAAAVSVAINANANALTANIDVCKIADAAATAAATNAAVARVAARNVAAMLAAFSTDTSTADDANAASTAAATNAAVASVAASNAAAISAAISTNTSTAENHQGILPLSDEVTAAFMSKVADTFVMGLVTLVTFVATYLLAWGKPGSTCIPSSVGGLSWMQVFIAPLPFAVFPITLFFNGLAKAAEKDSRLVNFVCCFCLAEFMAGIVLGAGMTYCAAGASLLYIGAVTVVLLCLLAVVWGITFKYPMCLRFLVSRCFGLLKDRLSRRAVAQV